MLNQYAVPRSQGGGTRHVDLFGRLTHWAPTIIATSRSHATQEVYTTDDKRFILVPTPGYDKNGVSRVLGWAVYAACAVVVGLRRRRLDLVYASSPQLLAAAAGYVVARVRRLPLVIEIRDLWPESIVAAGQMKAGGLPYRVLASLEKFLCTAADHIVVVTEGWETHFAELGVGISKISVIPNGTEAAEFAVDQPRSALREKWKIDGKTAIFAGSHGVKDGIDILLDAALELPQLNFLLIGAGSMKSAAENRVREQRLVNVRFQDPVPKSVLPELLAACDVGIHAVSPLEVFDKGMSPNKLFDYMAAGLPIVSNAAVGISRVTVDGECGRVGGPRDLTNCLRNVLAADDCVIAAWRAQGPRIVQARFSRAQASRRLEAILDAALASRARA